MAKDKKKSKDKAGTKTLSKSSVKPSKPTKASSSAAKVKPSGDKGKKSEKNSDAKKVKSVVKAEKLDKKSKKDKGIKVETKAKVAKSEKKVKLGKKSKKEKVVRIGKVIVRKSTTPAVHVPRAAPVKLNREMQEVRTRLQKMLVEMRRDIDHEVRGASARDLAHINDTSDMASDSAEGDLALRIAESETVEASEIERALEKLENGTYGICETCGTAIAQGRLEYLPYVTLCIKCQELSEIRKREDGDELDDLAEGSDVDAENN